MSRSALAASHRRQVRIVRSVIGGARLAIAIKRRTTPKRYKLPRFTLAAAWRSRSEMTTLGASPRFNKKRVIRKKSDNESAPWLLSPGNAQFGRQVGKLFGDLGSEGDSVSSPIDFGQSFGVAGDERALRAGGGSRLPKDIDPVIQAPFKLVGVHKPIQAPSAEEVAQALTDFTLS